MWIVKIFEWKILWCFIKHSLALRFRPYFWALTSWFAEKKSSQQNQTLCMFVRTRFPLYYQFVFPMNERWVHSSFVLQLCHHHRHIYFTDYFTVNQNGNSNRVCNFEMPWNSLELMKCWHLHFHLHWRCDFAAILGYFSGEI